MVGSSRCACTEEAWSSADQISPSIPSHRSAQLFGLRLHASAEQVNDVGVRIDWNGLQNPNPGNHTPRRLFRIPSHWLLKLSDESDLVRPEITQCSLKRRDVRKGVMKAVLESR